jgi:endoglucanase
MGNLLAFIPSGKPGAKKLLIDAHIDEVGLIVTAVEEGFLRFAGLGYVDARMFPGREVTVLSDPPLFGIISCLPPHLLTAEQMEKAIPVKDMYIDLGLSQEEVVKAVPLGTPVVYRDEPQKLLGQRLSAKAMDDRAGFTAILQALEILAGNSNTVDVGIDLIISATVQEELDFRGAGPAAYFAEPDYAIVVDVTPANTPDSGPLVNCVLGGGPSLNIGPAVDRRFIALINKAGEEAGIPLQVGVHNGSSDTNTQAIQISRSGIITAMVDIPCRYLHGPAEVVDLGDIEKAGRLIAETIRRIGSWGPSLERTLSEEAL